MTKELIPEENLSEFYDNLYSEKVNIKNLREQKRISPSKRFVRAVIKRNLKIPRDSRVLEIGCGVGDVIGFLDFGHREGADVSKSAIAKAQRMFPDCRFSVANANKKMPFKSESYDAIIMPDVIEHIVNEKNLLKECYRMLKKRGYLIISTDYSGREKDLVYPKPDKVTSFGIGGDLKEFGDEFLIRLRKQGFKIKRVKYISSKLSSGIWSLKEKLIGGNRKEISQNVMTGKFMNSSPHQRLLKRIFSAFLFWGYMAGYSTSFKKRRGLYFIIAVKS